MLCVPAENDILTNKMYYPGTYYPGPTVYAPHIRTELFIVTLYVKVAFCKTSQKVHNKQGDNCDETDDYTEVQILQDWRGSDGMFSPVIISSFEHTYIDHLVNQTYYSRGNGLNGRVKYMIVQPGINAPTTTTPAPDNGSGKAMTLSKTLSATSLMSIAMMYEYFA